MNKISNWIQQNKILTAIIVIALVYLGYINFYGLYPRHMSKNSFVESVTSSVGYADDMAMSVSPMMADRGIMPPVYPEDSVSIEQTDRKVVAESYLSMLVKDVVGTLGSIRQITESAGGFVVNSSMNQPTETSTGSIVVRVPSQQVPTVLESIRGLAVKVTMETTTGYDVTDQYTDYQARLATLEATLAKFEVLFDQATEVTDTLEVQRAIIQTQDQIDHITGRLEYLEQVSASSKITINLSTDELALPYAPDDAWRPMVVFKTAVRALVTDIRSLGSGLIWLAVYSPILIGGVIILLVGRLVIKRRNRQ